MYLLFLFSVVGRDVPSFSSPPPQLVYSRLPMMDGFNSGVHQTTTPRK